MSGRITTDNWNKAPNNRISFQYMQALFPTARLIRAAGPAHEFGSAQADVLTMGYTNSAGQSETVGEMLDRTFTDSFLVVKSGDIVTENYYNNMTPDSVHLMNSCTKTFVGMLAGVAVERGLLDPENLVCDYLPELNSSAWEGTTVRHLLDMTAGAAYGEDYTDPVADFWKETAVVGWKPELVTEGSPETLLDYAASLEGKDQEDGEKFHYRTVTTNVIGLILQKVMGHHLSRLLTDEIWSKLATRNDANVCVDRTGDLYVGAGMSARTRDLACFGMMLANNGEFAGEQIIPATWIDDTVSGVDKSHADMQASDYADLGIDHYRNQIWVRSKEGRTMMCLGIHGQIIYVDQNNDSVIVKLSTQPESVDTEMFLDSFAAMEAIVANL